MNNYEKEHPNYSKMLRFWERCRHLYLGEDAVKEFAENRGYLPRPYGMKAEVYFEYVNRATLLGLFASTVEGRLGDIQRKKILTSGSEELEIFWETMTLNNEGLTGLATQIMRELLITGRALALLDFKEDNQTFYTSLYRAEDIVYWEGEAEPTYIVLNEPRVKHEKANYYDEDIRLVLSLEEEGYLACRYLKTPQGWEKIEELTPTGPSGRLQEIPAVIFNCGHLGCKVADPPMLHLANLLLSIFRNSADYEQGLHALGVPTPVVSGIRKEDAKFALGPSTPIILEPPDAKVSFLEFSGAGLNQLKGAMDEKVMQAVMMGARLIQTRRQVESAEAAKTRMGAESSLLNVLVGTTEQGLKKLTKRFLAWKGSANPEEEEFKLEINRDFVDESFSPDAFKAINEAELQGVISPLVAFNLRKKFEIYPDGWTYQEERENLMQLGTGISANEG
jgi:hypothetical protein